jgi:hypothetical protein
MFMNKRFATFPCAEAVFPLKNDFGLSKYCFTPRANLSWPQHQVRTVFTVKLNRKFNSDFPNSAANSELDLDSGLQPDTLIVSRINPCPQPSSPSQQSSTFAAKHRTTRISSTIARDLPSTQAIVGQQGLLYEARREALKLKCHLHPNDNHGTDLHTAHRPSNDNVPTQVSDSKAERVSPVAEVVGNPSSLRRSIDRNHESVVTGVSGGKVHNEALPAISTAMIAATAPGRTAGRTEASASISPLGSRHAHCTFLQVRLNNPPPVPHSPLPSLT